MGKLSSCGRVQVRLFTGMPCARILQHAGGLNATVLDAWLLQMNLYFQMEDHIPVTKWETHAIMYLIGQTADWFCL